MIGAYLGFYAWISAKYSLKSMNQSFWEYEKYNIMLVSFYLIIIVILWND